MQYATNEQMMQLRRIYKRREDLWAFIKYNMVSRRPLLTDCFVGVLSSKGEEHQLEVSARHHLEWQESDVQLGHQEPWCPALERVGCRLELGDVQADSSFPGIHASWVEAWPPQAWKRFCLGHRFGSCWTMGPCLHQGHQAAEDYVQASEGNSPWIS